jgi:serine/threonine protein kinase
LGVLAFIHSKGVVHGNINPSSILISRQRQPSICDFSCAVKISEGERVVRARSSGFAAPELTDVSERLRPGYLGPWSDLYGLAGTMYFCLAGEQPKRGSLQRYVDELIEGYKVPWRFASAIGACMAADFDKRPRAATEVLRIFDVDEFGTGVREEPIGDESLDPSHSGAINQAIINL